MANNNFWGEPDEVDFPDWMLPDNHPNKTNVTRKKTTHSLNEAINAALAKPPINVTIDKPE